MTGVLAQTSADVRLPPLPEIVVPRGVLGAGRGAREVRPDGASVDAVAVPLAPAGGHDDLQPRWGAAGAVLLYGIDLADIADRLGATGAAGDAHTIHLPRLARGESPWDGLPGRLILVGTGDGSALAMRQAGAALARETSGLDRVMTTVGLDDPARNPGAVRAFAEGLLLASYRHPRWISGPPPAGPVGVAEFLTTAVASTETAVRDARVSADASVLARALSATPSSVKSPQWMAEQARRLGGLTASVAVDVHDEVWLAETGLNGVLAVGRASATPPRLVRVSYVPAQPTSTSRHVVLVGKGITYDTGGLALKPRESMAPMKTDMTGAAVVLAAVLGAASAGLRHRVTAVLPLAENALGADSWRPGDVLTLVDGTTVEIGNTDAEGRIVLADAMAWARQSLEPDILVDVATLTGAASLGLGKRHGALYANDDRLAEGLLAAGESTGEPLWRMPLVEDYRAALDSSVAEISHIATDPVIRAGSITAALFLQRFAAGVRWAHLDIAGPARSAKASHEVPEGATGFGARALLRWLEQLR